MAKYPGPVERLELYEALVASVDGVERKGAAILPRDRARRAPSMKPSHVPQTRLGRLSSMALTVGEFAIGGLAEGARRLVTGSDAPSSAFLTAANARRLAARLARLRGGAMKLGQMMSLQGADLLPPRRQRQLEGRTGQRFRER